MELVSSYDIMFDNIVEQIKNKCNEIYEFEIIKEEINIVLNIKFLKLSNDNRQSNSFIIDINNKKLIGKNIKFSVNSLKIKIINNRPYFLIQDYEILNQEKNKIIFQKLSPHLKSNLYKVITSVEEIKENYLYTLILKAKEIKIESQQYKFQLEDSNKNSINVDGSEKFDLENGKIYYFHGYIYNILSLKFEPTNISYIEEFSFSTLKIHNSEEILKSNINSLLNFKGKVKSFNITDNIIIIETEDKIEYKINANYHLIKQLVLNNECIFYNYFKKSNEEFIFSNLSFIEANEETFINFNFPFYDIEQKYYNKIKINDKLYDINNKNIKIKVEDKEKNNLFLQKISYERIIENKTLDSYIFYLELYKGKIYDLVSSLEKNGFSYEIIIQSIIEDNLPEYINVKLKEKIIKINPNKNDNKLKERFTIINFPKQDINTILGLSEDDNPIKDKDNFRYLLMIDNNNKKILTKFEKLESVDKQRKDFYIPLETENALKRASAQCYINFNKNYDDKLYNINKKDINIFVKLMSELMDGFQEFKFKNTKRQYNIIKDITSFSINYYAELFLGKYYSFRKNYEILLDSMINLEYIDRIKILLTFMVKIIRNSEKKKVFYDFIHLIDIDNEKSYEKFPFVKDAFDIFYKIIDNLTEDCPLFQAIYQFNSIIYCDKISNENLHSGSILNLNDIKLELVKNINRFLFLSEKPVEDCSQYADFEPLGLLVTIYMYSFCDDEFYNLDENNFKRATSVILFLLFQEYLGNQKKNIDNEKVKTSRKHCKNDFQEFQKVDTGSSLEIILIGKIINMVYLMNSSKSEKLLDPNLYTGKNFNKLQEIYSSIETDNINMISDTHQSNKINNSINSNNTQSSSSKIRKKKRRLMYTDLLQLYNGISEEEKEKLKDDEDYQRFLLMYERRYQKPSEYMKIPDIFALRKANKK